PSEKIAKLKQCNIRFWCDSGGIMSPVGSRKHAAWQNCGYVRFAESKMCPPTIRPLNFFRPNPLLGYSSALNRLSSAFTCWVFLTKTAKVDLCQNPGVGRFDSRRWWTVLPLIPFTTPPNRGLRTSAFCGARDRGRDDG